MTTGDLQPSLSAIRGSAASGSFVSDDRLLVAHGLHVL